MVDYNQYVADLYRNELGRTDDAISQGELDAWVSALASGGLTQQQVADMIERSPEGVAYDVNRIYGSELGRAPDDAGATSWGKALASGALTDDEFLNKVRQSGEYSTAAVQQYGDLLNNVYQQEVGRKPDEAGLAQWAAALRSGSIKPDQLSGLFSNTNEGWLYDQYGNLFKRAPDEGAKPWLDALEKGTLSRDQVLNMLRNSEEYARNNNKTPGVAVPGQTVGVPGGFSGYVTPYTNYAPMKAMPDPRSQTFGFLYDTIQQRLGNDPSVQQGLLGLNSIVPQAQASSPVNWAPGAQQQTPASTGGYAGTGTKTGANANNPNLVGGILDARNLVSSVYQQELNRAPDFAGLDSWSNAVYNGMTQQQLVDAIRASSEYQGLKSASTAEAPMASYDVGGGGR